MAVGPSWSASKVPGTSSDLAALPHVSPLKCPQCFYLETSACPLLARLLPLLPWDLQGEGGAVKVSGEHVLGRPRGASPGCRCWGRVCPGQSGWSPSALRGDRQLRSAVGNSSAFTRIRPLPESPHGRRCRGTRPPWPRGVLRCPGLPWARLPADMCLIRALPTLPCCLWPSRESPCHSAGAGRCSTGGCGHAVPLAGEAHGRVCHSVRTTVGLLWVLNKYVVDADLETTPGAKGRNAPVPGQPP